MKDTYSMYDESNPDNFEYKAVYDDGTKLTFIRSRYIDGGGKIVVYSPSGYKREYYFFQIPKKYQNAINNMKREFGYPGLSLLTPVFEPQAEQKPQNWIPVSAVIRVTQLKCPKCGTTCAIPFPECPECGIKLGESP